MSLRSATTCIKVFFWIFVLGTPWAVTEPILAGQGEPTVQKGSGDPFDFAAQWKQVENLISEQRLEAASKIVSTILDQARIANDSEQITRALIRETQLRHGLHSPETATRFLRDEPWPDDMRSRLILGLFYGDSLSRYLSDYHYEIAQREKVAAGDELDLKRWTKGQISAEIHRTYGDAWNQRDTWDDASIGDFAAYIEQNNYPARIRGTLRDAVTYLWVQHLDDRQLWGPREETDVPSVDVLLEESGSRGVPDPGAPSLVRALHLLDDLAGWHDRRGETEAALEARLTRIQKLFTFFHHSDDRKKIVRHLQDLLSDVDRGLPWWSKGQALLAEQTRQLDQPDSRRLARDLALEGAEAHPRSYGGKLCRSLVDQLERIDFGLETMAVDGAGRRSLQVTHTNLSRLFLRAYALEHLSPHGSRRHGTAPNRQEIETVLAGRRPVAEWTVDLPETTDLRPHRTFVTPPVDDIGLYLIIASRRLDFERRGNHMSAVVLNVSDLVVRLVNPSGMGNPEDAGWTVHARSGADGEPVSGARIAVYRQDWQQGHRLAFETSTDEQGQAFVRAADLRGSERGARGRHQSHFIVASTGSGDSLDQVHVPGSLFSHHRPSTPDRELRHLTYTDRSAYRPGQILHWKVAAYRPGGDTDTPASSPFQAAEGETLTVRLLDAGGEEVAAQEAKTNAWGSVSGRFELPTGRPLGSWTLVTDRNRRLTSIQVEEYKRPSFNVELGEPEAPARIDRETLVFGEARYYFGLPVQETAARWQVTRYPVYPRFFCWPPLPPAQPLVIASGVSKLDADGRFEVRFTPRADSRVNEDQRALVRWRYELHAEVTEPGGETRNASSSVIAGLVSVEADFESDLRFFTDDAPVRLGVRRHFADKDLPGSGSWTLKRLQQPEVAPLPADLTPLRTPDGETTAGDHQRPRWDTRYNHRELLASWPDGAAVATGDLTHGSDGRAVLETSLSAGAYRLIYRTEDGYGEALERRYEFLVAGQDSPGFVLPGLLLAQRDVVEVGDTARFLVSTAFDGQLQDVRLARGNGIEHRRLRSDGRPQILEFEVLPSDRGGFQAEQWLVRDYQSILSQTEVQVPWSDRELRVETATFRDTLRPGSRETWRVTVRAEDGRDLEEPPELLAYMFDKSLEYFGRHSYGNPGSYFPGMRAVPIGQVNLSTGRVVWQVRDGNGRPYLDSLSGDRLRFFDSLPIGGPGGRAFRGRSMPMMAMKSAPMAEAALSMDQSFEAAAAPESEVLAGTLEAPPDGGGAEPKPGPELRTNFEETALWKPHLLLDEDGGVSFEFTVPDSVTEWDLWIHALTRKLGHGRLNRQVRTVKDLLVRPSLPRFFRQGDRAELQVVISNSGTTPLTGRLDYEILDADTDADLSTDFGLRDHLAQPFEVAPGASITLSFPVTVPDRVGSVAVRAVASAGHPESDIELQDGELRPLPVLPSRLFLAQSRFAALQGPGSTSLRFEDLENAASDPSLSHESLVVTLDAQLFYGVLGSLPYLIEYPYECTEQTLNRFVSTGILSSLFERYPGVAKMAESLAQDRDTPLAAWTDDDDPNRRMLLEETPWLRRSRGGEMPENAELVKVLDPTVTEAQRRRSLAELSELQTPDGGFPWWGGGPPSPFITLYVLHGLSRALEYEVEVPREVVGKAWQYLAAWWASQGTTAHEKRSLATTTYLAWVLTRYPDPSWTGGVFSSDDVQTLIDSAWERRKELSPRLKGYLALVLSRHDRRHDALQLWESVMDSAQSDPRLGTYWAPEDRSWLWYNDTVESHAFALRVLTELAPDDSRRAGLVQWLLLDKQLGHWKSTRATAEAVYALVKYLETDDALAIVEDARVELGDHSQDFRFEPDEYSGADNHIVVPGSEVTPSMGSINVSKTTRGTLFAAATWHFATDVLPEKGDGDLFHVERTYFRRTLQSSPQGDEWTLEPLAEGAPVAVGDQIEVHLSIRAAHGAEYVHLKDPRAAGLEPEDRASGYRWDLVGHYREIRDSGTHFFFDRLPAGEYTLKYRLRAAVAGSFRVGPSRLQSMYAPEHTAYSAGHRLEIGAQQPPATATD